MKKIFLLFIGALINSIASAHDFEVDGIYYNIIDSSNNTVSVTFKGSYSFPSYSGYLIIPESVTYNGTTYSVISIGIDAFDACSNLTSVSIPNTVISIGDFAFHNCSKLISVTLGSSVTSIGELAFFNCINLNSFTIPASVTTIGKDAFSNCDSLITLHIDDGDSELYLSDYYPFYHCSIENLYVGRNLSSWSALCNSPKLKQVEIGNSVTAIGAGAFYGCNCITSLTIGNAVTSIGQDAFRSCSGLKEIIIPNSVKSIGNDAFYGCAGLKEMIIPNSVKSIGNNAFYGCTGLTSVTIGNSVKSIGDYAFRDCSGLTELIIPNSVDSIGSYAFEYCSALKTLRIDDGNSKLNLSYYSPFEAIENLYLGRNLSYSCWESSILKQVEIGDSVTLISEGAFRGCNRLTSVVIGNSISEIPKCAFQG